MVHPYEIETGCSTQEILDFLYSSMPIRGIIKGFLAEMKLERYLQDLKNNRQIKDFRKNDAHSKLPDFSVTRRRSSYQVECKTAQHSTNRLDIHGHSSDGRALEYYEIGWLDVLATIIHGKLVFVHESKLMRHTKEKNKYCRYQPLNLPWSVDLIEVLDEADRPTLDRYIPPQQTSLLNMC